ncbi:MAG: DUF1573 domain-containing protein [Verrucomicrobiales bacterium]|nr:DUF1573 domain-containing protein [Verrucomicrobiales bacterium]
MRKIELFIWMFMFGAAAARAGALSWSAEKLERRAAWADTELVYHYRFTNSGSRAVTLRDVAASCGCAELDRAVLKTYRAGDQGTLTARYRIGGRTGRRIETLMVESDEDGGRVYKLLLIADLPELAKLRPAFVHWNSGEKVSTKIIRVDWQGPGTAELSASAPDGEGWRVATKPIVSGKSWELLITPPTTDGDVIVQIPLRFRSAQAGEREARANAMLQRK